MAAHDSLGPQFLYHEAHLNDRESIRSQGLRPGKGWEKWGAPGEYHAPPGVYLSKKGTSEYSSSVHDASHFGYDRWRVNVGGLNVQADPTQESRSHFTAEAISPERLTLVKKGHPDWERHI